MLGWRVRMGVRHIVSSLWLVHCVALVSTETGADTGAGEEYLEMTETKWDGKTPWFTGSSMSSINILILIMTELCCSL